MDAASLPGALRKSVAPDAPANVKAMLARGEIPLGLVDRLTVLVLLEADGDEAVREAAAQGWAEMDPARIGSALADRTVGAALLDEIAARFAGERALILTILSHPNVTGDTLGRFVTSDDPALLDRIAQNQRVLLENPEAVRVLVENPALETSVAGRLRSLFGLSEGTEGLDADVTGATDAPPEQFDPDSLGEFSTEIPPELLADLEEGIKIDGAHAFESTNIYQLIQTLTIAEKIKLATLGSKSARRLLSKDSNRIVVNSVIRSPKLQEDEVVAFANDRTTPDDVLGYIMTRKDWMKNYQIKLGLCKNPKTPLPKALRILEGLFEKDLRALAKSRNVPAQIASAALRHVMKKSHH